MSINKSQSELVVVIATNGQSPFLRQTLQSLSECRKPDNYCKLIIIENGKKVKGVEEIVDSYRSSLNINYMYCAKPNKSHALNIVMGSLDDCFIVFTDDDVQFHPETLCLYAEASRKYGKGKYFGGPTAVLYEKQPPKWLIEFLPVSARGMVLSATEEMIIDKPIFLGFNWAAFASDLRKVDGFRDCFGPGSVYRATGQERNMQECLLKRNIQGVYIPRAMVWHHVPENKSDPAWILERSYKAGVYNGIKYVFEKKASDQSIASIMGVPRWMLRVYLERQCELLIESLRSNGISRFKANYKLQYWTGLLNGVRAGKKIENTLC